MYNYYLEKLMQERAKEQEQRSKAKEEKDNFHQTRTDMLKKRYWNRVENFMYNVA